EARHLAERFGELDFAGLLREFWRSTGKPPELVERFIAGDLAARAHAAEDVLDAIERERGAPVGEGERVLEVGCGTAALGAAAARRGADVTASDVSLRWLVLARKRPAEEGLENVELVGCA